MTTYVRENSYTKKKTDIVFSTYAVMNFVLLIAVNNQKITCHYQ